MRIKHSTKRKMIHYGAIVLLIAVLIGAALFGISVWDQKQGTFENTDDTTEPTAQVINYNGEAYQLKSDVETLLVVGLDTYEDNSDGTYYTNQQSDFLLLLVLDHGESTVSALQINRDTMTDINILGIAGQKIESRQMQIALSHSYGNGRQVGLRNTSDAVSGLLHDIDIDCAVSVTMDAVAPLNDKVGGVALEILEDFSEVDETLVKGETMTLTGEQALTYVRARGSVADGTNINRMNRQRQYLNALFKKVKETAAADETFIAVTAVEMADYFIANTTNEKLIELFEDVTEYEYTGIITLEGESVVGDQYMEFYPDASKLTATVVELFCEQDEK